MKKFFIKMCLAFGKHIPCTDGWFHFLSWIISTIISANCLISVFALSHSTVQTVIPACICLLDNLVSVVLFLCLCHLGPIHWSYNKDVTTHSMHSVQFIDCLIIISFAVFLIFSRSAIPDNFVVTNSSNGTTVPCLTLSIFLSFFIGPAFLICASILCFKEPDGDSCYNEDIIDFEKPIKKAQLDGKVIESVSVSSRDLRKWGPTWKNIYGYLNA